MQNTKSSETLSQSAVSQLREEIVQGEMPPGTKLAEAAVAERLGMSRVPVREALVMLEREGLVGYTETGRAYVKELTPHDFEELYTLRLALEPLGMRLAAPTLKADSSALHQNVRTLARALDLRDVTRLDLDFHELIMEASGNSRLLRLWRSLRSELEAWLGYMHRAHRLHVKTTRESTVKTHLEIIHCIETSTPAACERVTRRYVTSWRDWLPLESIEGEAGL